MSNFDELEKLVMSVVEYFDVGTPFGADLKMKMEKTRSDINSVASALCLMEEGQDPYTKDLSEQLTSK